MGFQLNATPAAQVEISGAVTTSYPDIPTGATRVQKTMLATSLVGTTPATIFTPTATKTLFITSMSLSSNGVSVIFKIGDNINGTFTAATYDNCVMFSPLGTLDQTIVWNFPIPLEVATALKWATSGTGTANVTISFVGYEI